MPSLYARALTAALILSPFGALAGCTNEAAEPDSDEANGGSMTSGMGGTAPSATGGASTGGIDAGTDAGATGGFDAGTGAVATGGGSGVGASAGTGSQRVARVRFVMKGVR